MGQKQTTKTEKAAWDKGGTGYEYKRNGKWYKLTKDGEVEIPGPTVIPMKGHTPGTAAPGGPTALPLAMTGPQAQAKLKKKRKPKPATPGSGAKGA